MVYALHCKSCVMGFVIMLWKVNVSCDIGDFFLVLPCLFLLFGFCLNVSVECVYGCEGFTHPWEGREALGEGHKLGLTLQLRKLPHDEGLLISWSMGSIKAMNLVVLGGTRRFW